MKAQKYYWIVGNNSTVIFTYNATEAGKALKDYKKNNPDNSISVFFAWSQYSKKQFKKDRGF